VVVLGDALEGLPQQEDAEHAGKRRDDQALVGVDPTQTEHDQEQRDQRDLEGDHHRRQIQDEDRVPPEEVQPGEAIGRHRADDQLPGDREHGDDQRVQEVPSERHQGEEVNVVGKIQCPGEELRRVGKRAARRLERGRDHPDERHDHAQRDQDQHGIAQDAQGQVPPMFRSNHRPFLLRTIARWPRTTRTPRGGACTTPAAE